MIWCSVLHPALDVVYKVKDFQHGNTYLDCRALQFPAGKGVNVAQFIHQLGEDVTVTGLLPELDAQRFMSYLSTQSINSSFYPVSGAVRINTTINDEVSGYSTHFSSISPKLSIRLQEEFIAFFNSKLQHGDRCCFTGSLPPGFEDTCYASLIECGLRKSCATMLDTRGAALKHGVRARPTMVKPNLAELEEFFEEPIQGVHHIALKGKKLLDCGIAFVFISLGADGLIALHKNDCLLCTAPQVPVVDSVGCGDALVAGFIVAEKRKFSFTEMCRMAVACGSAKCMQTGPGVISKETVWQLMEDVQITAI